MKAKVIQLGLVLVKVFFRTACSGDVNGVPEPRVSSKDSIEAGRHLIASYGCGFCHFIPRVPGANAIAAPLPRQELQMEGK